MKEEDALARGADHTAVRREVAPQVIDTCNVEQSSDDAHLTNDDVWDIKDSKTRLLGSVCEDTPSVEIVGGHIGESGFAGLCGPLSNVLVVILQRGEAPSVFPAAPGIKHCAERVGLVSEIDRPGDPVYLDLEDGDIHVVDGLAFVDFHLGCVEPVEVVGSVELGVGLLLHCGHEGAVGKLVCHVFVLSSLVVPVEDLAFVVVAKVVGVKKEIGLVGVEITKDEASGSIKIGCLCLPERNDRGLLYGNGTLAIVVIPVKLEGQEVHLVGRIGVVIRRIQCSFLHFKFFFFGSETVPLCSEEDEPNPKGNRQQLQTFVGCHFFTFDVVAVVRLFYTNRLQKSTFFCCLFFYSFV